jgi:hypothetical protein
MMKIINPLPLNGGGASGERIIFELPLKQNHIKGGTYGKVRRDHQI